MRTTNVYVAFETIESANEFKEVIVNNGRDEEFERVSSRSFSVSFPSDADYEDCKAEVEELMFQLGYDEGADYYFSE